MDTLLVVGDDRMRGMRPQVKLCVLGLLREWVGSQEFDILFTQAENFGSAQTGCGDLGR